MPGSADPKPALSAHVSGVQEGLAPSSNLSTAIVSNIVRQQDRPVPVKTVTLSTDKNNDLWSQAYEGLGEKFPSLVKDYEAILVEELKGTSALTTVVASTTAVLGHVGTPKRQEQMAAIMKKKLQDEEDARLKIQLGNKTVMFRDQIEKAVKVVTFAKDFITSAVSSDPHASLAWSGICVLLPVGYNSLSFLILSRLTDHSFS